MKPGKKELLLRDLCARLPYHTIVNYRGANVDLTLYTRSVRLEDCKPYLRSMSSMTEEERLYFHRNSARVQILVDEEKAITKPFYGYTVHLIDWLNEHYFDYRGLIEMGLALEAPEGMYNGTDTEKI